MTVMPANIYCTISDVEDILSQVGVAFSTDDVPPDSYGNALSKAGNKIDLYLSRRYDPTFLAQSDIVVDWAAAIAARFLRIRRGNPPPPGVLQLYDETMEELAAVKKGLLDIPGIAARRCHAPGMSKMRATQRPYPRAVVEKSQGTQVAGSATLAPQHTDPYDTFGWNDSGYLDYVI